jgi:biopolymer transport protein ExbB
MGHGPSQTKLRYALGAHKPLHPNAVHGTKQASPGGIRLAPELGEMGTTLGWFSEGGPIMLIIGLVGLAGLAIMIERAFVIVIRSKNNGRVFIERLIQLVRGGKIDEAIKLCASSSAALPDIGLLILRSRSRDESDLQNVAAAATLSVLPKLTRRLQYLPTLAAVSIMLGVLGTILGLHHTLIDTANAPDRAQQLSKGIAAALAPSALSLIVSSVLTLGRTYLVSQSESITEQIHELSARLINALIDRPDVRLGHR